MENLTSKIVVKNWHILGAAHKKLKSPWVHFEGMQYLLHVKANDKLSMYLFQRGRLGHGGDRPGLPFGRAVWFMVKIENTINIKTISFRFILKGDKWRFGFFPNCLAVLKTKWRKIIHPSLGQSWNRPKPVLFSSFFDKWNSVFG